MNDENEIVVYWRPGCGFCARLLGQLDARSVPHRRVNIWEDERAAAAVRQVASGNETVPTVFVGKVALVNPSLDVLLTAALTEAPAAVPVGWQPKPQGRAAAWLARRLAGGG